MVRVLKKYCELFLIIFKTSLIADLEYRVNFTVRILVDVLWYFMQILSFEVLYNHTPLIGDWNRSQARVFLGCLFVLDALFMIFVQENAERMGDKVRKGELDFLLTKPVNSQFLVSFQKLATASLANLIIATAFFIYSIYQLEGFMWIRLLWFIVIVPISLIVTYVTRFMFSCLNLIFVKSESVQFLWYNLYKLGMRPESIHLPFVRKILLTLIPMSFVANVPAKVILEPFNPTLIFWCLVAGPFYIYLSHIFWNYCLKYYSSASS